MHNTTTTRCVFQGCLQVVPMTALPVCRGHKPEATFGVWYGPETDKRFCAESDPFFPTARQLEAVPAVKVKTSVYVATVHVAATDAPR